MFYRFISEKLESRLNADERAAGHANFVYGDLSDATAARAKKMVVDKLGYFISPSHLFRNVHAGAKDNADLNITLGEFFTPQESSRLLAMITTWGKRRINKANDPACGSGSLLMQVAKVLGKDKVLGGFFGQEKEPTIHQLCRMKMFLHDIDPHKFDIGHARLRCAARRDPVHLLRANVHGASHRRASRPRCGPKIPPHLAARRR